MPGHILITGGAGFIGSHVADALLRKGHRVRVLDSLVPQVHGPERQRPKYLAPEVELIVGDIRDSDKLRRVLQGIDAVYHFAALVGVGQSMYQISDYVSVNCEGTAELLQCLLRNPVQSLIVASSMSVYGEGLYRDRQGRTFEGKARSFEQLRAGRWELLGPSQEPLEPLATPESKTTELDSVYALSKFDQERMCLLAGRAYNMPVVSLRFFNTYGTRQALSNPYTGVLAIFACRLLNHHSPLIFEDGLQRRDFVSVHDVVQACCRALECKEAAGKVFNVGSGFVQTVRQVAERMAKVMNKPGIEPEITGKYRVGDVRHCFPDISAAQQILGYAPQVNFEQGLLELAEWLQGQAARDRVEEMQSELASRGLTL